MKDLHAMTMTEFAIYAAKDAEYIGDGIYSIKDDNGELRIDVTKGSFMRIYPNGKIYQYSSGELSLAKKNYGVIKVTLNGVKKTIYQHIMVAVVVHLKDYSQGKIVGHKDSVKWHNDQGNLEWVTPKENADMDSLVYKLQVLYPDKYTELKRGINLDTFIASRYRIPHSKVSYLLSIINNKNAVESFFNLM